jgi:hypothetical protein
MKISQLFYKVTLLFGSLGFCISCAESLPKLPDETQTGAGTFGCLVNNELAFAESGSSYWGLNVGAEYNQDADLLQISAQCQFNQQFVFLINDPYKKNVDILIDTIRYLPPNSGEWMETVQTGHFRLSRIDNFDNGIVSGTFSFDLNEPGKTSIHVTIGRFDLKLYSY